MARSCVILLRSLSITSSQWSLFLHITTLKGCFPALAFSLSNFQNWFAGRNDLPCCMCSVRCHMTSSLGHRPVYLGWNPYQNEKWFSVLFCVKWNFIGWSQTGFGMGCHFINRSHSLACMMNLLERLEQMWMSHWRRCAWVACSSCFSNCQPNDMSKTPKDAISGMDEIPCAVGGDIRTLHKLAKCPFPILWLRVRMTGRIWCVTVHVLLQKSVCGLDFINCGKPG